MEKRSSSPRGLGKDGALNRTCCIHNLIVQAKYNSLALDEMQQGYIGARLIQHSVTLFPCSIVEKEPVLRTGMITYM